jgi:hypothetical protein
MFQNILVEAPNMKYHENPFSGIRVFPPEQTYGWTDVTKPSPLSLTSIIVLCSSLHEVLPSGVLPSRSPIKLCQHFFPKRAAYPSLLDLVNRIMYSEQYVSRTASLCSFLQPASTSVFLGWNIFFKTLSWHPSASSFLLFVRDQVSDNTNQLAKS